MVSVPEIMANLQLFCCIRSRGQFHILDRVATPMNICASQLHFQLSQNDFSEINLHIFFYERSIFRYLPNSSVFILNPIYFFDGFVIFGFYLFILFSCITLIKKSEITHICHLSSSLCPILSFLNFSFPHSNILSLADEY